MEVLEFALETIRRVDSGELVVYDVSHPKRMHWVGWERHVAIPKSECLRFETVVMTIPKSKCFPL